MHLTAWLCLLLIGCGQPASEQEHVGKGPITAVAAAAPNAGTPPATGPKSVWVVLRQQANLTQARAVRGWKQRGEQVYSSLVATATSTQAGLRAFLTAQSIPHEPHWIVNAIRVTAHQSTIDEISRRPEVARIVADVPHSVPPIQKGRSVPRVGTVEWGLANIRVPEAWQQFGTFGDGIVIANIDTGVEFTHPALVQQYRGNQGGSFDHNYNWFDPSGICGSPSFGPCDNNGHGTHTMGTMVGDDLAGNQVGVAPQARWIAAKGCETNSCSTSALLSSGEWVLAPTDVNGQNPRPDLRPHIVNNSWGGGFGDEFYRATVQAWVAAGIFPAFSQGNFGSSCGSASSPGDYPEAYGTGAYDIGNNLAFFSSRGPSYLGEIKPNISAPGVSVRSSVPGGGYEFFDGTSMASPHVAGMVALLWSSAPALFGDIEATRTILDTSAVDMNDLSCGGTAQDNNGFGEGRADAFAAVELAPRGPTGTLEGIVSATDGSPLPGAAVTAAGAEGVSRSTRTGPDGSYRLRLPVGTYTVTVALFGYLTANQAGVVISEDQSTVVSPVLGAAPSHVVSGTVLDTAGNPIPGARVSILPTPLPPAVTDAGGAFSFPAVPEGSYEISVEAGGCFERTTQPLVVDGEEALAFQLARRFDEYGYGCGATSYEFIEADTLLPVFDDGNFVPVQLPFSFVYYGQTIDSVVVSEDGYVVFDPNFFFFGENAPIPSSNPPNGIFPFWDDFRVDFDSSILTKVVGTAPNREFVIEWRDVVFWSDFSQRARFELILSEGGQIRFVYHTAAPGSFQRGGSASVGIESPTGSVGLEYSFNSESLESGTALLFAVPDAGVVRGIVTDRNTGLPVSGAEVRASRAGSADRIGGTNAAGEYQLLLTQGTYTLQVTKKNYGVESATVDVVKATTLRQDFSLRTPRAAVSPPTLEFVTVANQKRERTLVLSNTGSLPLTFSIKEAGGARQATVATAQLKRNTTARPNARNTRELFAPGVQAAGLTPMAVGDVLASFPATGLSLAWGVGFTGDVWLSDPPARKNAEFEVSGAVTGRGYPATWASDWAADMAYDATRGVLCQVNVGGDNGIYCWNPNDGQVTASITDRFAWNQTSQRGLAYRDVDDSFFIGGWNEGVVYHIAGLSAAVPGTVLGQCKPADGSISGIAYNGAMDVLWIATNSPTDTIYELNPDDCTVLSTLSHPFPGFNGGGLEMDDVGNLWTISQAQNSAYLLESGVPAFSDVPWLTVTPAEGTVAVNASARLTVKIDTAGLTPGIYLASIFVQSNAAGEPLIRIPVSLVVPQYQQGVNVGGSAYTDTLGDLWATDKKHANGSWGYVQKGSTVSTGHGITGTTEPRLFQDLREDPYAYRFDNVPNGTYEIDLRFAELDKVRVGRRLFDVIVENTLVLPAHDIQYEVGRYAADQYKFFVDVTDQRLDVRFIPRDGYLKPVVNALRVTRRSDR